MSKLVFESGVRSDYDSETNTWIEREILVSLSSEPVGRGATRTAFTMLVKEIEAQQRDESNQQETLDGSSRVVKWVAKKYWRYMTPEEAEEACKTDVMVQDIAMRYGRRFNQVAEKLEAEKKLNSSDETAPREGETKIDHENVERPIADEKSTPCSPQHVHSPLLASSDSLPCPPQRLEFVQASLLRLNSSYEYFVMEPYIEGEYWKHNSNNGKILHEGEWSDTPHAFSHFTFEESNHQVIVVDIQGVTTKEKLLFTDPQVHSSESGEIKQHGTGNLGIDGIAMFLYTHQCNSVCRYLNLTEFPHFCHSSDLLALNSPNFSRLTCSSPLSTPSSQHRHDHHSHHHHRHHRTPTSNSSSKLFAASLSRSREKAQKKLDEMSAETRQLQTPTKRKFVLHKLSSTCSFESPIANSSAQSSAVTTPQSSNANIIEMKNSTQNDNDSAIDNPEQPTGHSSATTPSNPRPTLQNRITIEFDHTPTKLQGKTSSSNDRLHHHHSHRHSSSHGLHSAHHSPQSRHRHSRSMELHLENFELSSSEGIRNVPKRREDSVHSLALLSDFLNNNCFSIQPQLDEVQPDRTIALLHFSLGKLHQMGALAELDRENVKEAKQMEKKRRQDEKEGKMAGSESELEEEASEADDEAYSDLIASICHFQRSVQLGSIEGCLALARLYTPHQTIFEGLALNIPNALELRNKYIALAAERSCKEACFWLGCFHQIGDGCKKDLSVAIRQFQAILEEPPKRVWWPVSDEVLELYSWRINLKTFEMKAQLAQMLSERLLEMDDPSGTSTATSPLSTPSKFVPSDPEKNLVTSIDNDTAAPIAEVDENHPDKNTLRESMTEMLEDSVRLLEEAIMLVSSSSGKFGSKKARSSETNTNASHRELDAELQQSLPESDSLDPDQLAPVDDHERKRSRIAEKYREGISAIRTRFLGQETT